MRNAWWSGLLAVLMTGVAAVAEGSNVAHMNLRDLVTRADRIVRGVVLESNEATVEAGGGSLPVTVYRIRVDEALKGSVRAGDVIEVRLLSQPKQSASGPYRRASLLRDLPQFAVARDYLFVLTRPSAIGLSTTVGLRQGIFELRGRPGQETAVNGANNVGLFTGMARSAVAAGPLTYSALAREIRALLRR
jgi:hypothetical protein